MDSAFFITLLASISLMSVASHCEHLSVMTNATDVDNRHHNKAWCMGTIMLYYYIYSLVHFYLFCSAFDIFLQDDMLIIILKSLKWRYDYAQRQNATKNYFTGRLFSTCASFVLNSATSSLCDIFLPKTEEQVANDLHSQKLRKYSAEAHMPSKWKSTFPPGQSKPCWELTYLRKNTPQFFTDQW